MSGRYQLRIFESVERDGATGVGTLLEQISLTFSLYADSADGAEILLRNEIHKGKRSRGRVYQICPVQGHELTRSLAAALDGSFHHVFLDPASGPYSEARRIRLPGAVGETAPEHSQPSVQP